jgi:HSP20 family protein
MRPHFPSFFGNGPLGALREQMDELLQRFSFDWEGGEMNLGSPSVDVSETDGEIQIKMDVPGMKPEELDIQVSGDHVTISGEHTEESEEKGRRFHRVERRSGSFQRTIRMPCAVNEQDVDAEYQDGVLTVTLAKAQEAKTHKIPIKG